MELKATIETWKKGKWYLARIPELDFLSQGRDLEEAKVNLMAASRVKSRLDPFFYPDHPQFSGSENQRGPAGRIARKRKTVRGPGGR